MQRAFLILTLGIAVCLQSHGCSKSSSKRVGRWAREAQRGWGPDLFFDDPNVLRLCEAIRKKDYAEIDRLVKTEGVDINATGRMNVTPLFWAFPLGFAEALDKIPRDAKGMPIGSEVVAVQEEYLGKHARLLEHLLKLKANPNIKTTPIILARLLREHKHITVPGDAFDFVEGLSVTHLAALAYYQSEISFLPIVLANGGDPNLVGTDGQTPVLLACGAGFGWIHSGAPSAENVALMIEAGADFEIRDSGGNTPILVAAHHGHSRVVFMLLHAGVDFRLKNDSGRGLAGYTQQHQRYLVSRAKRWLEESPDADWVRFDPYHLEVADILEQEGLLAEGTRAEWKREFDQLIEKHDRVAYEDRDPFVDEWVAKRQKERETLGMGKEAGSDGKGIRWQELRQWKPNLLFDDPKVIELCYAMADRNYERIDRLVKDDGVDINSKGYQDITPMLWVFALFWPEAAQNTPDRGDGSGEEFDQKLISSQQKLAAEYSQLLEHLMKLGADPNAKLTKPPPRMGSRLWVSSPIAFDMREGLALTHVSTRHYLRARHSFFRTVMAGGGDPNLVYDYRGVTPIFLVCNNARYLPNTVGIAPSDPKNLAILLDADVDLEFRDPQEWAGRPKWNTPILAAAESEHFDLVYMLLNARADSRATNEKGWGLAKYAGDYLLAVEKLPRRKPRPGKSHGVDPYFLDVVRFLEKEGVVSEGTYADYKTQIDRVVEASDNVVYGDRDRFVDEWVAKRQGLRESPEQDKTISKANAAE